MKTINLYFIHGFLQDNTVWNGIGNNILSNSSNVQRHYINLLESISPAAENWSKEFNKSIRGSANNLNIIIGYSLGGRLAMHSIIGKPELWAAGVLIGAHPGYKTTQEKNDTLMFDFKWSKKLQYEPFEKVVNDWNSLPIFGNKQNYFSPNSKYRNAYSEICKNYSKGHQLDLTEKIIKPGLPLLYLSGSNDIKYKTIGDDLANKSNSIRHVVVENSFHRVPWENRDMFIKVVNDFLEILQ